MSELLQLLQDLRSPGVLPELALLLLALGLAWGASRWLGQGARPDSVWFGRSLWDGLMFPTLALVLTYGAKLAWTQHHAGASVLKVAVPVLLSLAAIRLLARVMSAVFPQSQGVRLIERGFSWVAWLLAVLWITGGLPIVLAELEAIHLSFGKTHLDLRTLLEGVLSSSLVLVLALWLSATIERKVLAQTVQDLSMRKVASNALRALLLLLGLLFVLSAVGVDLTALSVLGGALGVGLGFGLQKLAANYVSGFVILLERSLRIGDHVKIDGFEGKITDIKTRYTQIRAANGREAIVPNEALITQRVENLSLVDSKILLTCTVTVSYDSDVPHLQKLLCEAALSCPRVLAEPAPAAHLALLGNDGLEFTVAFWINDPDNGQLNVRSAVNVAILNALRQAHVMITSPPTDWRHQSGAPGV